MSSISFDEALQRLQDAPGSGHAHEVAGLIRQLGFNHPTHFGDDLQTGGLNLQQMPDELAKAAILLARLFRDKGPIRYLEVGVGSCGTLIFLHHFLHKHGIKVHSTAADSLLYESSSGLTDQKEKIAWCQQNIGTDFYLGDVAEPRFFEFLAGKRFEAILIDADHIYESCLRDHINCAPHLTENGVMMLHDVESEACPGVTRVFKEIKEQYRYSETIASRGTKCGIGVLIGRQDSAVKPQVPQYEDTAT